MENSVVPQKTHRVLVSAGDPSGDLLVSEVLKELQIRLADSGTKLEIVGLAGPRCESLGMQMIAPAHEVAVVGLWEIVRHLPRIFSVLARMGEAMKSCDSVLCVDFPDFNFRLVQMAKKIGKPVDWLVAPQVWAWRSGRMDLMARSLRRVYPALGFEEGLLKQAGVEARFLGHPLRDRLPPRNRAKAREELRLSSKDFALCVMPGSRSSELRRHLKLLAESWKKFPWALERTGGVLAGQSSAGMRLRAVWPLAPGWTLEAALAETDPGTRLLIQSWLKSGEWVCSSDSSTAQMACDFGWIVSGTATLEAAYYQLPHILVYKLSALSAFLIRSLTSYFDEGAGSAGLPNIVIGKKVFPELLQENLTPQRLALESAEILGDGQQMGNLRRQLRWIPKKLGEPGASARIAADLAQVWGAS